MDFQINFKWPISKKLFLKGKFPGITEFIAKKYKKKIAMLIYNKKLSVVL